jgi:hypothetical protein
VVGGRHAHLVTAQVTRTGDTLRVRAVWEHHGHATLASSSDGFTTTTYVDGQVRRLLPGARWPGTQPSASTRREAGLEDLAAARVPSLQPGTAALLGILDGAGASPLRAAARSVDGGATWRHVDVTGQRQARGYVTGGLVLQDGRLLVLEGHDTDRRARPADLRVSAGDDWTRYGAWRARFVPGLRGASVASLSGSRDPDPVVWATTTGQSLYVSSDGARTFRRVAARPHRPGRGRPPR